MARFELKPKATKMRQSGSSVLEISRALQISKSTASSWCRDIKLTDIQRQRLYERMITEGHAGRLRGAQINKDKKIASHK